ncbi:MAG: hypothetical protein HOK35_03395 [Cytophagia bacterium]|nr:hypothetical protein [Cytophagia bacterium]
MEDNIAKRLFIVEAVELGAMKSRLASALEISRQTIDNYLGIKKHFGLEKGVEIIKIKKVRIASNNFF